MRTIMWLRRVIPGVTLVLALVDCNASTNASAPANAATTSPAPSSVTLRAPDGGGFPALTVTSSAFANGSSMPTAVAFAGCGGGNVSPDLQWSGAPSATKSFVVTEFDPDAPTGVGFWHWLLFNIPPTTTQLALGAGTSAPLGSAGLSDYGSLGYGGPCPPAGDGAHRYRFVVSALDTVLVGLPPNSTTGAFLTFNARGHILAQGTYQGLYAR